MKRGSKVAVVLFALSATTGCGPQAGDLYALDCSRSAGTGERTIRNEVMFGRHPELVVVDEGEGKIFYVSENIDRPMLSDACGQRLIACILEFSPSGGRGHSETNGESIELVYDRATLRFTLNVERAQRSGAPQSLTASWLCTQTEFPTDLWRARP